MTKRIFASIFSVSMLVLILSMSLVSYFLYDNSIRLGIMDLQNESNILSVAYENNGIELLKKMTSQNRITIINPEGKVIYDNQVFNDYLPSHKDREEILEAKEEGIAETRRYSKTMNTTYIYYAKRLGDGNILRIAQARKSHLALLTNMLTQIVIVVLLSAVLSYLIAKYSAKRIVKPLESINVNTLDQVETYEELAPFLQIINKQNKKIKRSLRQVKRRTIELESVIQNMTEGILLLSSDYQLIAYNKTSARIFHLSEGDIGKNVFYINRSEAIRDMMQSLELDDQYETFLPIDGRRYKWITNKVVDNSKTLGYSIYLIDQTETYNREVLRREFTTNVTHELKTPLTSISGYAEIIAQGIAKEEDIKKFAESIHQQAQKLILMVNEILKISKLESHKYYKDREMIEIDSMIRSIFSDLQIKAQEKNVTMRLVGDKVNYVSYVKVMQEVLTNLIDNAIKYNRQNGFVKITLKESKHDITIVCEDDGMGINDTDLDRIFERFYRGDKSRSNEVEGSGLGLSIVKHGVQMMDGTITVENKPNTKFIIQLKK